MKRVTATCTWVVILGATSAGAGEPSGSRHRVFWETALGPVLSDNVYRDRSQEGAAGYDVYLQAGLRSRHSPQTFSQFLYELDAGGFRRVDVENWIQHTLRGLVRHRIGETVTLELTAGVHFLRFPNVAVFDSRTYFGQAGLRTYLGARTTLEAGLDLEARSYPDYDLDYKGVGLFATLGHELGRRTYGEVSTAFQRNGYSERRALDPASPDPAAGPLRSEHDWLASGRLVRDLTATSRLELGYRHAQLSANGAFLDFGPYQSRFLNDIPGDERVVGDYYSHRRHEASVRFRKLVRRGFYVTLACRYQHRAYDGRLAKDDQEQFLSPEQLRHDRGFLASATWDVPLPRIPQRARLAHPGLRLQLLHEINSSNDALYDYHQSAVALLLTSWF